MAAKSFVYVRYRELFSAPLPKCTRAETANMCVFVKEDCTPFFFSTAVPESR